MFKRILLTSTFLAALVGGSLVVADTAEARRGRYYRGYYGPPARAYYYAPPYRAYYGTPYYRPYYGGYYYGPRYYGPGWGRSGVSFYLGF